MDHSEVIAFLMKLLGPYGIKLGESWLKKRDAKASIKQLSEITDEILEAHSKLPQGSVVEYNEKGWKVTSITPADLSALVNRANVRAQAKQLIGQLCLENVIAEAANELESAESLPDQKPDPTWMLRFLGYAEGMADTYLKELWGKVLAGEIKQPGSFLLRTLEVLSTMTQREAELFKLAAKYAFYQPRDLYLPREANLFKDSGLRYRDLIELAEIGLLQPADTVIYPFKNGRTETIFAFSDYVAVLAVQDPEYKSRVEPGLNVWVFTKAGRQLTQFFLWETAPGYVDAFCEEIKKLGWLPKIGSYTNLEMPEFHEEPLEQRGPPQA